MNSIKAFFNRVTQCSIDPASYRTLRGQGLGSAYWYLYRLLWITSLVVVCWLAAGLVHALPHMKSVMSEIESTLPTIYPKQLVVKVQSGALTTNVKEPFEIAFPQKWQESLNGDSDAAIPKNLAVFDTKGNPQEYEKYNTVVLFTKNYMVAGKDSGELRMIPYDKLEKPLDINYNDYQDGLKKGFAAFKDFVPVAKTIVIASFIIAPFLFAGFALLWWMFLLVISTLLIWFVSSMAKWPYTFGDIYKLSVFGATPVIILGMLLWLVGVSIPWVLHIYFFVWMYVILKKLK